MLILAIRTDKPEAEIGLFDDDKEPTNFKWQAHRELSTTIHKKIESMLKTNNFDWVDIKGIVFFKGPGSFTGLRIGASVSNALAESLPAPVVGFTGRDWIKKGIASLKSGQNDKAVLPDYGRPAKTTLPKK